METVRKAIKEQLIATLLDSYEEDATDFSELNHKAFNEDYYIIGHWNAGEWLRIKNLDIFEVIGVVQEYEKHVYGDTFTAINAESVVNMYAYIKGEELLEELKFLLDECTKAELICALEDLTD